MLLVGAETDGSVPRDAAVLAVEGVLASAVIHRLQVRHVPAQLLDGVPRPRALVLRLILAKADPGSRWQRIVVGFGAGRSDLQVELSLGFEGDRTQTLLSSRIEAESGSEPGAALAVIGLATGPALLAAAQGGLSAAHLSGRGMDENIQQAAQAIDVRLDQYFRIVGWLDWTSAPGSVLGARPISVPAPTPVDSLPVDLR